MEHYDYVYIEDESYLRKLWEWNAKSKGILLLTLASTQSFEENRNLISKEKTSIYLDSNLGDGQLKGEDFAMILHEEGFQKIYLATGSNKKEFASLPWLKCVQKTCPFLD